MIKNYYATYTISLELQDVYQNLSRRMRLRITSKNKDNIDVIQFLNEQGANYTIHLCVHRENPTHTRICVTVEEDYMNMFFLQTDERIQTLSDEQLAEELLAK